MSPNSTIVANNCNGVERRRAGRKIIKETVLLSLPGQITLQQCGLRDLTALGAGLDLEGITLLPTKFALSFDGFRTSFACNLIWRAGDRGGIEFLA